MAMYSVFVMVWISFFVTRWLWWKIFSAIGHGFHIFDSSVRSWLAIDYENGITVVGYNVRKIFFLSAVLKIKIDYFGLGFSFIAFDWHG